MFDTILVAVDPSDAARAATDLALRLAAEDKASLILLSVIDVSKLVAVSGYESPYPGDAGAMLRETSEDLLAQTKAQCEKEGIKAESVLGEGDACDEILRVADERGVGLICIGTDGRNGLSRLFFGSVAEGVLRRSHVPVLATRPQQLPGERVGVAAAAQASQ